MNKLARLEHREHVSPIKFGSSSYWLIFLNGMAIFSFQTESPPQSIVDDINAAAEAWAENRVREAVKMFKRKRGKKS